MSAENSPQITLQRVLELLRDKCADYHSRYASIFNSMDKDLESPFALYVEAIVDDAKEWMRSFPETDRSESALGKSKTAMMYLLKHDEVRSALTAKICDDAIKQLGKAWLKNKDELVKTRQQMTAITHDPTIAGILETSDVTDDDVPNLSELLDEITTLKTACDQVKMENTMLKKALEEVEESKKELKEFVVELVEDYCEGKREMRHYQRLLTHW